jgi:hypothetical protein
MTNKDSLVLLFLVLLSLLLGFSGGYITAKKKNKYEETNVRHVSDSIKLEYTVKIKDLEIGLLKDKETILNATNKELDSIFNSYGF